MPFALSMLQAQTPRAAQVQRLLQSHAGQFAETGEAWCICHRAEIGNATDFLRCTRRLVGPAVKAWWYHTPWPRRAPSNVLVLRHRDVAPTVMEGQ